MFLEICEKCHKEYICGLPVKTVGLKRTGNICQQGGRRGKCRSANSGKHSCRCHITWGLQHIIIIHLANYQTWAGAFKNSIPLSFFNLQMLCTFVYSGIACFKLLRILNINPSPSRPAKTGWPPVHYFTLSNAK